MNVRSRVDLLRALIAGRLPLEPLQRELATHPWDVEEPLVLVRATDVGSVLRRYLDGVMTAADVEGWANALEMRDDVSFEANERQQVADLIFQLANPELHRALTRERAAELLGAIGAGTA